MFFKSSNFSIIDHTIIPFDILKECDKKIQALSATSEGELFFTQENNIFKYKATKKNKSQDEIVKLKSVNNLIISGDVCGCIKIFSKTILIRSYHEHTHKINCIDLYNGKILISASDDATIKFYDIIENKSFKTLDWFGDRVKCFKIFENILYIGVCNGFIYGIDLETYNKIYEFDTKTPVHNIEIHNGIIYYSTVNKVFKIITESQYIGSHTKQITDMKILNNKICTISLDGFYKIWSLKGQLITKINFSSPILSFGSYDQIFYFGLEVGTLCQLGGTKPTKKTELIKNKYMRDFEEQIQYKLFEQNCLKNSQLEKLIKKYEHKGALKLALDQQNFKDTFSVLYLLYNNRKLKNALLFLEKDYLLKLLDFIIENLQIRDLFEILQEVIYIVLSVYLEDFTDDDDLYDKLTFLSEVVDEECCFQEKLIEAYSYIECFK